MGLSLIRDKNGMFWIGANEGLFRFDRANRKVSQYLTDPRDSSSGIRDRVDKIYQSPFDSGNVLWIGSTNGLYRLDTENHSCVHYTPDATSDNSISDFRIISLLADAPTHGKILWIGTWSGGLNLYDPILNKYYHIKFEEGVQQSVQYNCITAIIGDKFSQDNVIWIGTDGGGFSRLWYKNENQYYFEHYQYNQNDINSLSDNSVTSLLQDKNGLIWVGTKNGGLNRFNPKSKEFKIYTSLDNNSCITNISCLYEFIDGNIWIGTNGSGLIEFDPLNEKCTNYKFDYQNPNSLNSNKILSINSFSENDKDYLLIGTEGGGFNV